jgi:Uma2 family endonuclease
MNQRSYPVPQTDPPRSPRETLPSMYDLPSEDPEEPGLPDVFHDLQPQLLSATLRLRTYPADQVFTGTDLNLYYDVRHSLWHKRPDWFLVLGVPRLYDEVDLRASYVVWQEGVNPFVVVELLSPGTEKEDLGNYADSATALESELESESDTEVEAELPQIANGRSAKEKPSSKWQVYEQILRVPYYIVFSRYTNQLRFFQLIGGHYQEQSLDPANPRIWIPELELGLGLWHGEYDGIIRQWLRWYDEQGTWIPTDAERNQVLAQQAEQERQRAEQAERQLRQVVSNLVRQGMSTAQVAQLTGLSAAEVEGLAE